MSTDRQSSNAACTLSVAEHAARMAWIEELNASALRCYDREGHRLRLCYQPAAAARARELVRREQECCPFLHITTDEQDDAFVVIIEAPAELGSAADALFASYAAPR